MGDGGLRRLGDIGARAVRDFVASLGLDADVAAGARPRVVADMVASVDGRAAVDGRSVALGNPADRELLRELRTAADAILVGPSTLRAERYANLLDDDQRARRVAAGRPAHPLLVTVSRRLALPVAEAPVFEEAGVPIVAFTESDAAAPAVGADLEVVRHDPGSLTLLKVLTELGARGVRGVLCEGGPTLLRGLIAEGALDDLLVTVAPLVVGGDGPTILSGDVIGPEPPPRLTLQEVHRAEDHLFLHYGLGQ